MLQLYQQFYREVGVRRFNELLFPRLGVFKGFPRNSVYHHFTNDDDSMFPDGDKPWFHGYSQRLPLDLVTSSDHMTGASRKIPFQPSRFLISFIRQFKFFRYVPKAVEHPTDDRTLVVVNYNTLKFVYRYQDTTIAEYQKWMGFQETFWDNISEAAMKSTRQQFIILEPPKSLPGLGLITNYGKQPDNVVARIFDTHEKRIVLHLAKFLEPATRGTSVFSRIKKEALSRVNLIYLLPDGRCSVVNLAYLYSWVKGDEKLVDDKTTMQRDARIVIGGFLKYLMVLSSSIPEDASEPEAQTIDEETDDVEADDDENNEGFASGVKVGLKKPAVLTNYGKPSPNEEPKAAVAKTDSESLLKSIEEDLAILEVESRRDLYRRGIATTGADGELIDTSAEDAIKASFEAISERVYVSHNPAEALSLKIEEALKDGTLNPATYKRAKMDATKYTKMEDPYGTQQLAQDRTKIEPDALLIPQENTQLKDSPTVLDKSMTASTLQDFTRGYIKNHHRNDILKAVGALQKGGVIIQSHEISIEHNVMGAVELHHIELKPINGAASSVWFKLPVVEENGNFKVAGNKYLMRKQRVDLPIRKISPTEVSLSSYYGKAFVSTENKMSSNTSAWILKQVEKASFEGSDWIRDVIPGSNFDSYVKAPWIYSLLSTRFKSFRAGNAFLSFDNTEESLPKLDLRYRDGATYCGTMTNEDRSQSPIFVTKENKFYCIHPAEGQKNLGDIFDILQLDPHDAPIRFSELAIFRKNVPVGVVLGYRLGWSNLLTLLKVTPRIVEPRKRLNLESHEYPIPFLDGVYVFSRNDRFATMILAGYQEYAKVTKTLNVKNFEHQDVYLNLLQSKGLSAIYIREIDMLFDYFVDPITEEILKDMNEPTTFDGLLMRSTELLMTYDHPKSHDGAFTRIRGYERFSGAVYREMTAAVRQFRAKNIAGRSKIEISPYKVWQSINEDSTKMMVPDINPIQDLKNDEGVTYVGEGGRTADGINKASRSFHVNDVGVVSEGTVDSSDVGVNIYSSYNPNLKNYRGLKDASKDVKSANLHCSAVLLAPGAIHDDQQRINFINVQSSHVIQASGYHPAYVRTGFESVAAERMSEMFAYCAKEDGKVLSVSPKGLVIEYKSGKREGLEIGRVFGRSEGSIFPFDLKAAVKPGEMFTKGQPITFNESYFEFDPWNPKSLVMKHSLTAKVMLCETKQTHEDASAISQKLSKRLGTRMTYMRGFVTTFGQNVHHVIPPGQQVQPQDVLLSIEDEITSGLGSFSAGALETLKGLSKQSPRANYHGKVDRIEVFYHGDKDNMSPSLRKLADLSDAFLAEQAKASQKPTFTGQVTDDYRVEGTPLGINKAEIRFYITVEMNMGVADKIVLANQMKSVNSQVMPYQLFTEAGEEIDATFGCRSIAARNVMSPYILGTTTTLLKLFTKQAVKLFNE